MTEVMNMINTFDKELKCYSKIINCYMEHKEDSYQKELSKNKSIISLIKTSKCKNDKNFIRNALLIVLSLYDDKPADIYDNLGIDIKSYSEEEKKELQNEMKEIMISLL